MGRNIPLGEVHPIHHPIVYFSFMIACISATIAIFSSLCGSLTKKKSPPPTPCNNTRDNNENPFAVSTTSPNDETSPRYDVSFKRTDQDSNDQSQLQGEESTFLQQPLPPPPSMRATSSNNSHIRANSVAPTSHSRSNSSSSQGKLSTSVSMNKGFGSSLGSRQSSRREDSNYDKKRDKKLKDEDSIWRKQIILGEKCKVPPADEDDDTFLYDENGNRISAYHPKTPIGLAISRQSSNVEEDAIPK